MTSAPLPLPHAWSRPLLLLAALLLGACAASGRSGPPEPPLKIINWNVLYGFQGGETLGAATEWLAAQQPDVVALQELNGFTGEELTAAARGWGHLHAVTHKESGFPVGLSSRWPIRVLERRSEGFHHGFLHARTAGIHFFVVHFWPGKGEEVARILQRVQPLLDRGEAVVVLGDFNGTSPKDADFLRQHATGREPDSEFVDQVEALGFVDLSHKHDPSAKVSCPSPVTIPRWSRDLAELETKRYRIDFVFADPELARGSRSGTIARGPVLDTISDHYPVIVELEAPATSERPLRTTKER